MKLVYKTPPRPYQVKALKFLIRNGGGGLYVPLRWGKSFVAINACAAWYLREGIRKVLIVSPNDVIDVWIEEIQKHCPVAYSVYDKNGMPMCKAEGSGPKLIFQIRNYESMYDRDRDDDGSWAGVTDRYLIDWDPDVVVVDESHHIGNPSALQSKKTVQVGRMARFKIFQTGTPWHRKPFYQFGMFKFYDESILGSNFGQFKRMIAVMGGYGGYEVLRYINLKWLRNKIRPHVFIATKVPTAPPVHRKITFSLTKSAAVYNKMEKEDVIHVKGEEVVAPIILTRHLRLQQIAGGWVKTPTGKYRRVGSEKKQAFARRVEEYKEQDIKKFVVGARFVPELSDIYHVVVDAGYKPILYHGGVDRETRTRRRHEFAGTENAVFIAQIQAAKQGIDLSTSDLMVLYSLPVDFLSLAQFMGRIEKYEETRTLLYEFMVAKGTRDEVSFKAMQLQKDVIELIMKHPKLVEKILAKKS